MQKRDNTLKITVVGCGRWGSCIAWYLDSVGHDVTLYGRENSPHYVAFLKDRTNGLVTLPESIALLCDLEEALRRSDTIVLSIGAQSLRSFMREASRYPLENKDFVLCIKGIEIESGKLLHEVMAEFLPPSCRVAVWVGPGHVQEFVKGHPNCMVIDSADRDFTKYLADSFSGGIIRFYYGSDLVGTEVGSAAKNVIGIAAGILDGLNRSSLKGALMSRSVVETARLIRKMGGNPASAFGLSMLGDFEATVFSPYSHNRTFGECFAAGKPYKELAEGYFTAKALHSLCRQYEVEMPICDAVYRVLYENADVKSAMEGLFSRSRKEEFNF